MRLLKILYCSLMFFTALSPTFSGKTFEEDILEVEEYKKGNIEKPILGEDKWNEYWFNYIEYRVENKYKTCLDYLDEIYWDKPDATFWFLQTGGKYGFLRKVPSYKEKRKIYFILECLSEEIFYGKYTPAEESVEKTTYIKILDQMVDNRKTEGKLKQEKKGEQKKYQIALRVYSKIFGLCKEKLGVEYIATPNSNLDNIKKRIYGSCKGISPEEAYLFYKSDCLQNRNHLYMSSKRDFFLRKDEENKEDIIKFATQDSLLRSRESDLRELSILIPQDLEWIQTEFIPIDWSIEEEIYEYEFFELEKEEIEKNSPKPEEYIFAILNKEVEMFN